MDATIYFWLYKKEKISGKGNFPEQKYAKAEKKIKFVLRLT